MEGLGGEVGPRAPPPSRMTLLRRRALALAVAALATAGLWLLLFRGDGGNAEDEPERAAGVSEATASLVEGLDAEERVDQVLLIGFEGSSPPLAILEELESRQVGGVLVAAANWPDRASGAELVERLRAAGLPTTPQLTLRNRTD